MKSNCKITFSGDIMLDNSIREEYRNETKNEYDFNKIFYDVKGLLKNNDYMVGNLETPISKNKNELKNDKYIFTSPIEFAKAVKNAGFDMVSTANNHCLDNEVNGVKRTLESLNDVGLESTGIFNKPEKMFIKNINGIKVAFLAATYGTNAFSNGVYLRREDKYDVNLLQNQEESDKIKKKIYYSKNIVCRIIRKVLKIMHYEQLNLQPFERNEKSLKKKKILKRKIKKLKENSDIVIFLMHEGGQYNSSPSNKTKKTIKFLKKCGTDIIIGNHEHVIHPVEINNNSLVAYSHGNFDGINGVLEKPFDKMSEYSILLNIYLNKNERKIEINKVSFNILKTIKDEENGKKSIKVEELIKLYEHADRYEKEKLKQDNKKIVEIVTGKEYKNDKIEKENLS